MSAESIWQRYRWPLSLAFVVFLVGPPVLIWSFADKEPADWISAWGQWLSALFAATAAATAAFVYQAQAAQLADSKEMLKIARRDHALRHYDWRSELCNKIADELIGTKDRLAVIRAIIEGNESIPTGLPRSYQRKWNRFLWTVGSLYDDCFDTGIEKLMSGPLEIVGKAIRDKDPALKRIRAAVLHEG